MISKKTIGLFHNKSDLSIRTSNTLRDLLLAKGFAVVTWFEKDALLNICIGGDGSFLKNIHDSNFSSTPFLGVNTGTLGFFQEIQPANLNLLVNSLVSESYTIERLKLVESTIYTANRVYTLKAVNEFAIKGVESKTIHLDIFIDDSLFEKISGDGVIVSTPTGSTAYSYSCGGSIVSPKLEVLQLTPIAPLVSKAYRCLANSLIVPSTSHIVIVPEYRFEDNIIIISDGTEHIFTDILRIDFRFSNKDLNKLVVHEKSFWNNVKDKFL